MLNESGRVGILVLFLILEPYSLTFLAPGLVWWKIIFPRPGVEGDGFRGIQVHCIYFAFYVYYYSIMMQSEIITQLAIMQNQWESWACFPATRWCRLEWWETVMPTVCCLCPVYSVISFQLLSLQKTPFYKDRMLEMEAGFSVLLWPSQDIPSWF